MKSLLSSTKKMFLVSCFHRALDIEGDVVEVGVYNGGSLFALVNHAQAFSMEKKFYGFDTFKGLVDVSNLDGPYIHNGMFSSSLDYLKTLLPTVNFVEGIFPSSAASLKIEKISFAHIDVDTYESTLRSLDFVWPILEMGGVIVVDDYHYYKTPGVTKAVEEFLDFQLKSKSPHSGTDLRILHGAPHGQIAFEKYNQRG